MLHENEPSLTIPLIARAATFAGRTAIAAPEGTFSYAHLLETSRRVAAHLLAGRPDLAETRVVYLVPPGFLYPAIQWGIWRAGGIAVPLCVSHPAPELDYVVADTGAEVAIADPTFEPVLRPIAETRGLRFVPATGLLGDTPAVLPGIGAERAALILYTSGTTSRPKGVVSTHANLQAQVTSLVEAWGWTAADHILLVLPLHHVHGIVNVLTCALWSGAVCEILPEFDAQAVWERIVRGDLTLFMGVPTMYVRLIAAWEQASAAEQRAMSTAARRLRLMVSGSAALPVSTLERWREISGHTLLERYGMTEIGMALSNPLHGERRPGHVGSPLPGVEVRLVDEAGRPVANGTPGEIQVKGPGVFRKYWRRPEATAAAFQDGWFRSGDIAVIEEGAYRILGRNSVDIIKSGGYKISALEVEEMLRAHPAIRECAVVGLPDDEWGERVAAALVLRAGHTLTLAELRAWGKERLAAYKVPTRMLIVGDLPRNAMGKVTKPAIVAAFESTAG